MGTVSPINGHIDYTWPEWISVDFKLPEESGNYLCYVYHDSADLAKWNSLIKDSYPERIVEEEYGDIMVLRYSSKHKVFNTADEIAPEFARLFTLPVTHWMPLPPLPQED